MPKISNHLARDATATEDSQFIEFERQIDDAFDYLRELTGIFVPPEDIHSFIRHQDLPREKVLHHMERIGQAFHLSLRVMRLSGKSPAQRESQALFFLSL
jgi:hypothetical protein